MITLSVNSVLFAAFDYATACRYVALAGFEGVEISVIQGQHDHVGLTDGWRAKAAEMRAIAADHGLAITSLELGEDPELLPVALEAAKELGASVVAAGGGGGEAGNADDLQRAIDSAAAAAELGAKVIKHDPNVSKLSIVGLGMATQTGVADRMFRALAEADVNIQAITTSQIKVSVLVTQEKAIEALQAVHREFELEKSPRARVTYSDTISAAKRTDAIAVVDRLQHMEDLTIEDVVLNESQARVTMALVPDQPGIAARIFEGIAAEDLLVDMIVQSVGLDDYANVLSLIHI